ncbi:MAG TPA: VOC family protein, partial [Candidatus Sulfotelmatobacter sp.]|nr:VOC family protein [Candidatus Sulfotelmatobacter sp.]
MSDTTAPGPQRIYPMLAYDDAPAAMDFLRDAFGFIETFRMPMPDGKIGHAQMRLSGNDIMLATTWKDGGLASPMDLPAMPYQLFVEV